MLQLKPTIVKMAATRLIDPVSSNLSMLSYNSTGWSTFKADFINTIMLSHSIHICGLQEHFQLKDNVVKIEQHFKDCEVFSLPAYKSNQCIQSGRPSGGLAFIYQRN